jgi:pyrroloquinoline quinone biosynthesis protein E
VSAAEPSAEEHRPYTLVAELTYRCPLRCAYCSNPVALARERAELDTATWERVFGEAEGLGVVQLHLTGGEPLLRPDLEALVARGTELGLYTNLITSAVPLTRDRLSALKALGLCSIQISVQGVTEAGAARIAGRSWLAEKLQAARWAREMELPLTLNVVLHRENVHEVPALVALAAELGAGRLELANTQYLGWALENRTALLPSREQIERARREATAARDRFRGRMEILFVLPDYYADRPRACMDGWGRRYLLVSPDGRVLPCHQAHTIAGLHFDRVHDGPLSRLWAEGSGLNAFRGEAFMPEPCRSCERRAIDFGGCRCQAFHLTGDAGATDPACALSPRHELVRGIRAATAAPTELVALRLRAPPREAGA